MSAAEHDDDRAGGLHDDLAEGLGDDLAGDLAGDLAEGVAVVGMSCRFPGAHDLEAFWRLLREGSEAVTFFGEEELRAAGVEGELLRNPNYVKARGLIEGAELFDAGLFGMTPREAEITDPQHRLFLECAWEALEHAGYDTSQYEGRVGVYGGASTNTYLVNLYSNPDVFASVDAMQLSIGNDKDYLTTRVAYKLNLKGPCLTVQSACSTSLAAVHLACRSLLGYQCDMALAGGVKIVLPQATGYLYQEGGMNSPDGHCRAFDARARGTVGGNGVGVVVLKRLEDALADGDFVHAVIRGSALNNDGSQKIGYAAPGIEGQAEVVEEAQAIAGVDAESITYVEAHGTGTPLGDPIEIAALTRAFRAATAKRQFCAVGSVKTNIGHLDAAAGVAGLIKTVLALRHGLIPPTLHFEEPNPRIDFAASPFYVNARALRWPRGDEPRRAGVHSYSIGGTNVHLVLEEAPPREEARPSHRSQHLLTLSANSEAALREASANLAAHLRREGEQDLADVAYTLHVGRRQLPWRRAVVCRDREEAAAALERAERVTPNFGAFERRRAELILLFPGEGEWEAGLWREMYRSEPEFRAAFEEGSRALRSVAGLDLKDLFGGGGDVRRAFAEPEAARAEALCDAVTFLNEYALGRLLLHWGLRPDAFVGEGFGELVAACLAGVFDIEDALRLADFGGEARQASGQAVHFATRAAPKAPSVPFVSRVTGSWLTPEEAADPLYWAGRARRAKLSDAALGQLLTRPAALLFEVGTVGHFRARLCAHASFSDERTTFVTPEPAAGDGSEMAGLLAALGAAWAAGAQVNWKNFHAHERRRRICLPTYPFERREYFVPPPLHVTARPEASRAQKAKRAAETHGAESQGIEIEGIEAQAASGHEQRARRHPRPALSTEYAPPRTAREHELARIWEEVLGVEPVGIQDDFFELGGDSVIGLQVAAKAARAGIRLAPQQVFEHPTVEGLAAAAETAARDGHADESAAAETELVDGPVPLTPIQLWFFEQDFSHPEHFNQTVLLESRRRLDPSVLEKAVRALLVQHDALRLRFVRGEGGVRQFNEASVEDVPFVSLDLRALTGSQFASAVEQAARDIQRGLDLERGPLMRVALFRGGEGAADRLLLVVHHLAVDAVSWRFLLEDLVTAYTQLSGGEHLRLPRKTTSFKRWAERLTRFAQSEEVAREADYWRAALRGEHARLPRDFPEGSNTEESAQIVSRTLDADETRGLLQGVPRLYGAGVGEALLAALAHACARWAGGTRLLFETEGHGREPFAEDLDISRTVGWFTTLFPVALDLGEGTDLPRRMGLVREQFRGIPRRGLGYGLLRYFSANSELRRELAAAPAPELLFHYLGQLDSVIPESSPLAPAPESAGPAHSLQPHRRYLLEFKAFVGEGRLSLSLAYSANLHRRETAERLLREVSEALRELVARSPAATEQPPPLAEQTPAPAESGLAQVSRATLERLEAEGRRVEDIYPLSPLQQGLLFHSLAYPRSGAYVTQSGATLRGRFDPEAFERAWQRVLDTHEVLRTSFVWEDVPEPLQLVERGVTLRFERHDWRGLDEAAQRERLEEYLRSSREQGLKLSRAPLMRLALFELAESVWHFVWNQHHVLLDGWSMPLLLADVVECYRAERAGRVPLLEPRPPFRDYIEWLRRQDVSGAETLWREFLKGFESPTPLPLCRAEPGEQYVAAAQEAADFRLPRQATADLRDFARGHGLTLNTLVEGAWALLLRAHTGAPDVVFGVTVSGRPAGLPGVERIIGMFVNTLPMRVRVTGESELLPWLSTVQERQARIRLYEQTPLVDVQGWSEVPRRLPLFRTLITFQNVPNPLAPAHAGAPAEDLQISSDTATRTHYPLTLLVEPSDELSARLLYDPSLYGAHAVERIWRGLEALLNSMCARPGASLGALLAEFAEAEARRHLQQEERREAARLGKLRSVRPKAVGRQEP